MAVSRPRTLQAASSLRGAQPRGNPGFRVPPWIAAGLRPSQWRNRFGLAARTARRPSAPPL